jgi:hypothetical protein
MILHLVEDHDGIQSAGRAGTEDSQEKEWEDESHGGCAVSPKTRAKGKN